MKEAWNTNFQWHAVLAARWMMAFSLVQGPFQLDRGASSSGSGSSLNPGRESERRTQQEKASFNEASTKTEH